MLALLRRDVPSVHSNYHHASEPVTRLWCDVGWGNFCDRNHRASGRASEAEPFVKQDVAPILHIEAVIESRITRGC